LWRHISKVVAYPKKINAYILIFLMKEKKGLIETGFHAQMIICARLLSVRIKMKKMKEYRYNYKCRSFSVSLFDEDGTVLFDCIFIYNNLDTDSLLIYDRLRFDRKCVIGFPICYSFTDTKCEEAVRYRMVELLQKNPHLSLSELVKITGHSRSTTTRHYMFLKRNLGSLTNI
jgi:hypothetical protein